MAGAAEVVLARPVRTRPCWPEGYTASARDLTDRHR